MLWRGRFIFENQASARALLTLVQDDGLVEDEKMRHERGFRGRRLVKEKLDWGGFARKPLEAYQRVMSV